MAGSLKKQRTDKGSYSPGAFGASERAAAIRREVASEERWAALPAPSAVACSCRTLALASETACASHGQHKKVNGPARWWLRSGPFGGLRRAHPGGGEIQVTGFSTAVKDFVGRGPR